MGMFPYTFVISYNMIIEIQCEKYDVPHTENHRKQEKNDSSSFLFDITLSFYPPISCFCLSFHRSIFNSCIQPYFCSLLPVVAASILPSLLEPDTDSQASTPLSRTPGILSGQSSVTRPCPPPPSVQSQHSSHFHPPTYPCC